MRSFFLILFFLAFPFTASAVETPPGQVPIDASQVLRGRFVQESQMKGFNAPVQSSGHFVIAPTHGLIWGLEKPFPTSTIVTPKVSVQDVGGMIIKLPIKNLRHLYDMVGGALTGDWGGLEKDYIITPGQSADHWQMLLTPRPNAKATLPYVSITVSGGRFVEHIAMIKADGSADTLSFTDETLARPPLKADESAAFNEAGQ